MADTELYTSVTLKGENYTIRKFTARDGLKVARMLLAKAAPIMPELFAAESGGKKKGASGNDQLFGVIGAVLDRLDDADIDFLVDKCLRVCYRQMKAGPQAVIDEDGHYGVEGVEYDPGLTISLCVEAIKWGAGDFFGENGLDLSQVKALTGKSPNR